MARPKKPEERRRIRDVAFNVFTRQGFEGASFSDIAKEASVSKSLVQYYFPKKEQFIADFIQKSLNVTGQIIDTDFDYEFHHDLAKLYAVGYAQYLFSMYNSRMNALRIDILRDRGTTEMVVRQVIDWILENSNTFDRDDPVELDNFKKKIVFVVGGAFDYLYDCLMYEVDIDLDFLSESAFKILEQYMGPPFEEGAAIRKAMDPEWQKRAIRKYNRLIFTVGSDY